MHKIKILSIAATCVVVVIGSILFVQPPAVTVKNFPETEQADEPVPDFSVHDQVQDKKQAFFNYLRPEIEAQNQYILSVRDFINQLRAKHLAKQTITSAQQAELKWLMKEYRVKENKDKLKVFDALLLKIDIVPAELVLVQAANESAWGTSRFARKGYNFFGLWCFREGCGFVPKRRNDGAVHEVAKFDDLSTAMYTYIRNLNRHQAYSEMRLIRQQQRKNMQTISPARLAEGLHNYSERGDDYVEELKQMIRVNKRLMNAPQDS